MTKSKMINKLLAKLGKTCEERDFARRKCEELIGEMHSMNQQIEKLKDENKSLIGCTVKSEPIITVMNGFCFRVNDADDLKESLEIYTDHITQKVHSKYQALKDAIKSIKEV